MLLAPHRPPRSTGPPLARPGAALAAVFVAAVLLPAAMVKEPQLVLGVLIAAAVGVVLATRLALALGLLVVASPFEAYLDEASPGAVKALGAVVVGAAIVRRLAGGARGAPVRHRALTALVVFLLLVVCSTTLHGSGGAGSTAVRYLSFGLVCVIAVAVLREGATLRAVLATFVLACTAASLAATSTYLQGGSGRAEGPLEDPNDLAFFLASAVPLALALAGGARGRVRGLWLLCTAVLLVGGALTLSRGAAIALAVLLLWGLGRGVVRIGPVLAALALAAVALGAVAAANPDLVETSLTQKGRIGERNVETRTLRWEAAALMALDNPSLGVGPGGFAEAYRDYAFSEQDDDTDVVSHQMYLEVAAELGLPALLAFLAVLLLAWRAAARASSPDDRAPPGDALLALGVQGSLLVVLTAALFLSEQYYLPLWLLVASAVALDLRRSGPVTAA